MRNQSGYIFIIMLLALAVSSMIFMRKSMSLSSRKYAREEATMQALAQARDALVGYALTYRDMHDTEVFGYLPCPDSSDKAGIFHPGDGSAAGNCGQAGQASIGLLPYRTLQLPDLRDADGNCLWYAVSGSHKNNPKGSDADAPLLLNGDLRGQFRIRDTSGNLLVTPDDAQGGAVAVIFAPGPALAGQARSPTGYPCSADPSEYAKYIDVVPSFPNDDATFTQGQVDSAINNDSVLWITAREVYARISLRADFRNPSDAAPIGQINRFLDETRAALEYKIQDDLLNHAGIPTASLPTALRPPATQVSYASYYQQFPGKLIGEPPAIAALFDAKYTSYLVNWRDHLRYAVCSNVSSGCFTVAGQQDCRGVLLFGGERVGGGLRSTAEKVSSSLTPPPPPPPLSAFLVNYFEPAGGGLDILASAGTAYTGATQYADAHRSADVGKCLFPGTFTALKNAAASFVVSTSPEAPAAFVDPLAATLFLGSPAAIDAAGCIWAPDRLTLDSGLRAYFKFNIAMHGEGFVFAIVDGNPSLNGNPPGCGAAGNALGYAGSLFGTLNYPKIGLEIDTRQSPVRNDPGADHFAFVYWGGIDSTSDDNTHGAGVPGSATQPFNPRRLTTDKGISSVKESDTYLPYAGSLPVNTDIHVRFDLTRRYPVPVAAKRGEYQLRVYVASKFGDCQLADFRNLAADLNRLCKQAEKISDTVLIDDIAELGPAMQSIYAGFTSGQTAASAQQISITDFMLRSF